MALPTAQVTAVCYNRASSRPKTTTMKSMIKKPIHAAVQLAGIVFLVGFISGCSSSGGGSDDDFVVLTPEVPEAQQQPRAFALADAYNANSPYKDVLKDCYDAAEGEECTFTQLPLLGQSSGGNPTIPDIMDRVIVSHDWMGVRFEQLLTRMPAEALQLFKPVAVIFIGSELTFSSYAAFRGALKVDPESLWLTADEKTALTNDTGTGGGSTDSTRDDLQFRTRWTLAKNGLGLNRRLSASEREFGDIYDFFAYSTYADLAFAFDLFPESSYTEDRPLATPAVIFNETINSNSVVTDPLYQDANLTVINSVLNGVVDVYYDDVPATDAQKALTAEEIGNIFDQEGRATLWSYTRDYRDTYRLFAMAMMQYKHNVTLNVLFLDGTEVNDNSTIAYGIKNRLATPETAPRAKFVLERMIGESAELDSFFSSSIGSPEYITPGTTYGSYLDEFFPPAAADSAIGARSQDNFE